MGGGGGGGATKVCGGSINFAKQSRLRVLSPDASRLSKKFWPRVCQLDQIEANTEEEFLQSDQRVSAKRRSNLGIKEQMFDHCSSKV